MTPTSIEYGRQVGGPAPAMLARAALIGGTIAGVLDILAAFALSAAYGGSPVRVLQGIASGVLGPAAFTGGAPTALLGLGLHFVIALAAAAIYCAASRVWPILVRRAVACGLAYGVAVYAVMTYVVVPLSRVTPRSSRWQIAAILVAIHMLCIGLPIALATARAARRLEPRNP